MATKGKFNYYAVSRGHQVGIFSTWEDTHVQVIGFSHNKFKGYDDLPAAIDAMENAGITEPTLYGPGMIPLSLSHFLNIADQDNSSQCLTTHILSSLSHSHVPSHREPIMPLIQEINDDYSDSDSAIISSDLDTEVTFPKQFLLENSSLINDYNDVHKPTTNVQANTKTSFEHENVTQNTVNPSQTNTKSSNDASTQTDIHGSLLNELLNRLEERDTVISQLTQEINLVKVQMKNEIKSQLKSVLEENQESNIILSEIKQTNERIKSSILDQKNLTKDLLKMSNNMNKRGIEIEQELEILKEKMDALSRETEKIHQSQTYFPNTSILASQSPNINEKCLSNESESRIIKCNSEISSDIDPKHSPSRESSDITSTHVMSSPEFDRKKPPSEYKENYPMKHELSPKDKLFSIDLASEDFSDSDVFIIGDSQISLIESQRMNPPGKDDIITKICVPGITDYNVYEWLKCHAPQQGVNEVIIHVGANTCMKGQAVKREHWNFLIKEAKRVFPGAQIIMSSIIPVGSRNRLFPLIDASLNNLWEACKDSAVTMVDHTNDFLTSNHAPRLELFSKTLHPNLKGTGRMAKNLKYPFSKSNEYKEKEEAAWTIDGNNHHSKPDMNDSFKSSRNRNDLKSSNHTTNKMLKNELLTKLSELFINYFPE